MNRRAFFLRLFGAVAALVGVAGMRRVVVTEELPPMESLTAYADRMEGTMLRPDGSTARVFIYNGNGQWNLRGDRRVWICPHGSWIAIEQPDCA